MYKQPLLCDLERKLQPQCSSQVVEVNVIVLCYIWTTFGLTLCNIITFLNVYQITVIDGNLEIHVLVLFLLWLLNRSLVEPSLTSQVHIVIKINYDFKLRTSFYDVLTQHILDSNCLTLWQNQWMYIREVMNNKQRGWL